MSNMTTWAQAELDRLVTPDDDGTQKLINKDIMQIVDLFSKQGHSGFSASYALGILEKLLSWKPITPLTGEEGEWGKVHDKNRNTQQNKRCSAVFRDNFDNSTARYIEGRVFRDETKSYWSNGQLSSIPVKFPFTVPAKPEYIDLPEKFWHRLDNKEVLTWLKEQGYETIEPRPKKDFSFPSPDIEDMGTSLSPEKKDK